MAVSCAIMHSCIHAINVRLDINCLQTPMNAFPVVLDVQLVHLAALLQHALLAMQATI